MTSAVQRLLEPESKAGTAFELAVIALVFLFGVVLVAGGVVSRPAVTDRTIVVFGAGMFIGVALTLLIHFSATVRRRRARIWVPMAVVFVATLLVLYLLRAGILGSTTLFLWGMGLLPGAAVTRVFVYIRARDAGRMR